MALISPGTSGPLASPFPGPTFNSPGGIPDLGNLVSSLGTISCCSHFPDEETESQRSEVEYLESAGQDLNAELITKLECFFIVRCFRPHHIATCLVLYFSEERKITSRVRCTHIYENSSQAYSSWLLWYVHMPGEGDQPF